MLTAACLIGPAVTAAHAATVRDLIELKKAGLSDRVLIALIQTDGSVFTLRPGDIVELHNDGLSDDVIEAMLRTAESAPVVTAPVEIPPAPQAAVDVAEPALQEPAVVEVPVPVPVYVPVVTTVVTTHPRVEHQVTGAPAGVSAVSNVPLRPAVQVQPAPQPVYWGWGGQRRPDSWNDGHPAAGSGSGSGKPGGGGR